MEIAPILILLYGKIGLYFNMAYKTISLFAVIMVFCGHNLTRDTVVTRNDESYCNAV